MSHTLSFRGTTIPEFDPESLSPAEADAVEGVTGLSFKRINRLRSRCVCDHGAQSHIRPSVEGQPEVDDSSCSECDDCPEFEPDMPSIVETAMTWVAIKRVLPGTSFSDVNNAPGTDFALVEVAGEPDPTDEPQPTA